MDRGFQADEVGHEPRQEGAHRVAQIPPESVDTEARGSPRRMGVVGDGGQERWVNHRGAEALEGRRDDPDSVGRYQDREPYPTRLDDHAPRDQALPPPAVGERPRRDLEKTPADRIHRLHHTDALDAKTQGREIEGIEPPRHPVVQIVDEAGLAGGEEADITEAGDIEDAAEGRRATLRRARFRARLHGNVAPCLADYQDAHEEADDRDRDPKIERLRAQGVLPGDVAGDPRHYPDGEVAGELVEAQG